MSDKKYNAVNVKWEVPFIGKEYFECNFYFDKEVTKKEIKEIIEELSRPGLVFTENLSQHMDGNYGKIKKVNMQKIHHRKVDKYENSSNLTNARFFDENLKWKEIK